MPGLIWIQSVWRSGGIPIRNFRKSWFLRKSADDKYHPKLMISSPTKVSSTDKLSNSLNPVQARQNVGPDLDQICLTLWWYSWKNFSKKMILKKISRRQNCPKLHISLPSIVLSADNLCKLFGPWSGPTERRVWSGSNLFKNLVVFL